MKILIWFACAFVYSIIVTGLSASGIMLGGIPTVCLLGCIFVAGRYICKIYDDSKKAKQEEPESAKPPTAIQNQNTSEPTPITPTKPVEAKMPPPSLSVASTNSYKNAYIIALVVSACLFLVCVVLGLRYYYDTENLKKTIVDHDQTIQQLEVDLKAVTDDLKYKDSHIQIIQDTVKRRSINAYNEGIHDGYMQGYDAAAKLKGKAKTIDKFDFGEEYEFSQKIEELYREYDE